MTLVAHDVTQISKTLPLLMVLFLYSYQLMFLYIYILFPGIKRGRYSLVRKTNHIMEVKGLQSTDLSPAPSKQILPPSDVTAQHSNSLPATPSGELSGRLNDVTKTVAFDEFHKRKSLTDILCESFIKYCRFPRHILKNIASIQEEYAVSRLDKSVAYLETLAYWWRLITSARAPP